MVMSPNSQLREENLELFRKVIWETQIRLRKFLDVAEKGLIHDLWVQGFSSEMRKWIQTWYPTVKTWLKELRHLERIIDKVPMTNRSFYELLKDIFTNPKFQTFVASAISHLENMVTKRDEIGLSMLQQMVGIGRIQKDIETKNLARLWLAEY